MKTRHTEHARPVRDANLAIWEVAGAVKELIQEGKVPNFGLPEARAKTRRWFRWRNSGDRGRQSILSR